MKIFLFVLLVLYSNVERASGNCRDGWESYNNSCYLFSHEKASWSEASAFCTALHSHLATILSANEHNYIISAISHHTGASTRNYWVDGTDEEVENVWRWASTDRLLTYIKWGRNQPDQAQGGSCLLLWSGDNYLMADDDCSTHFYFICQTTSSSIETEIVG